MDDRFTDFRTALLGEEDEDMSRFRALVVNVVLATDISDKELKELRNKRWKKSFSQDASIKEDPAVGVNRKATIVIEHLIQVSRKRETNYLRARYRFHSAHPFPS